MNRRTLLKAGLLAGIATAIPTEIFAETKKNIIPKMGIPAFRKLVVGEAEITIFSDGYVHDTDVDRYAPRANVAKLKTILRDNFRSEEYIEMGMNIALIRLKDRLILTDSGLGRFSDKINGFLVEKLSAEGVNAGDITDVLISHAHPDHIGGLLDREGNTVFKNATHHISKKEVDFWNNATADSFSKSGLVKKMPRENFKGFIDSIRATLAAIKSQTKYYNTEEKLYGAFSFIPIPGHTPGMVLTKLTSGKEELIFVADLIHSDILLFPHPEWGFYGDTDIDLAIATRKKILSDLARNKTKTVAYHLPYPGIGHVVKDRESYKWLPEAYFTV